MRRRSAPSFPKTWFDGTIASMARDIAAGEPWFRVWAFQGGKPYPTIAHRTKIAIERLDAITAGAPITRDELERLCRLWEIEPERVEATLPAGAVATV